MKRTNAHRHFYCATVGYSDGIESSNIVGYQNKDSASKDTIMLNTFMDVGNGSAMTLGDISANPFDDSEDGDYDVWGWTGFTPFSDFVQTMNKTGQFTGKFTYAPAGYKNGCAAGWYDFDDKNCSTPKNDVSVPFTDGFYLHAGNGAGGLPPALVFAGQVKSDKTIIPVASSSMLTGNATPIKITLGDISANSFDDSEDGDYDVWGWTGFTPFSDFIQVMNDKGQFIGKYTYAPEGYKNGNIAGWYDFDDKSCTTPMNSIELEPGQAFYLHAGNGAGGLAPTITIPTAIPAAK